MRRCRRPWLVAVPLATLGVLAGHALAYWITGTPAGQIHGYLSHLPHVALLLAVLSVGGASLVERGERLALWPFPAVVVAGFVVQEHVERLAHDGSVPFLLDKPFFVVGLAVQALVAVAVWLLARLLLRLVGRTVPLPPRHGSPAEVRHRARSVPVGAAIAGSLGARSPPLGRCR